MGNRTVVIVLVIAAIVVAGALTMRAHDGGALHRWFAAIHGR